MLKEMSVSMFLKNNLSLIDSRKSLEKNEHAEVYPHCLKCF